MNTLRHNIERRLVNFWYQEPKILNYLLWPASIIYALMMRIRRIIFSRFCWQPPVPVIVVGNLTVGGVGKTPLVIAVAKELTAKGLRVGIVSRGYGSSVGSAVHVVSAQDKAAVVGDEPLLLAQKTCVPVIIAKKRAKAAALLVKFKIDVIISDDGLQHIALGRKIEIVVVDGARGFGNGMCLPAGPLRESVARLNSVDFIVVNGASSLTTLNSAYRMDVIGKSFITVKTGISVDSLPEHTAAVAGIGNPARFFATLHAMGINFTPYIFPNHHLFCQQDFASITQPIVMTEKDAVKCRDFASNTMHALEVEAVLSQHFWVALWRKISE